jgi:hypothetical protein
MRDQTWFVLVARMQWDARDRFRRPHFEIPNLLPAPVVVLSDGGRSRVRVTDHHQDQGQNCGKLHPLASLHQGLCSPT